MKHQLLLSYFPSLSLRITSILLLLLFLVSVCNAENENNNNNHLMLRSRELQRQEQEPSQPIQNVGGGGRGQHGGQGSYNQNQNEDCIKVQVEVHANDHPEQISFQFYGKKDGLLFSKNNNDGTMAPNQSVEYEACLQEQCFVYFQFDSGNDGTCNNSSGDCGYIRIKVGDDPPIFKFGLFTSKYSVVAGDC